MVVKLVCAAALALLPAAALGQERTWTMHVAGGLSLPTGTLNTDFKTGWHVLAGGWWAAPDQPWGIRLDAAYNRFGLAAARAVVLGSGERTAFSLTASGTYRISMGTQLLPYAMIGFGGYWTSCTEQTVCDSSTDIGWNLGAGTQLTVLGLPSFLEMRYHTAGDRGSFFPLTFGVRF